MNRTDRLLGILLELQARGELRAEDLASRFEVSVRTVYRDVQALSETGVPVVASPGKGYRLMEGYFLPPLSFSAPEAALLILGGEFVKERVDPELRRVAESALTRLAGVVPPARRPEVARRRREIDFHSSRHPGEDPRLPPIRAAVEEGRVIRLLYHAYRRPSPEPRTVEPYMLVHLAQAWHLAAYCRLRRAPRLFRLDRIDRLEVLAERFTLGERHHRHPEWEGGAGGDGRDREARVRFDPSVVRWVRERQPYFFRREEPPANAPENAEATPGPVATAGPVFVYNLRDEAALLSWLLSWGGAFTVLDPGPLRDRVATAARAVLARHAPPPAPPHAATPVRSPKSEVPSPTSPTAPAAPAMTVSGAPR
jgi:predicted DNA-binding transcriptional regulator YafY